MYIYICVYIYIYIRIILLEPHQCSEEHLLENLLKPYG